MGINKKLILTLCMVLLIIGTVSATWWDGDWEFRKEVNITGGTEILYNFTVLLNVSYNSNMQTDFDDIRFTNESCSSATQDTASELSYEFDEIIESNSALVWIKFPILNTGINQICLNYNNPSVSSGENHLNTWDDDYVGVYHITNGSGSNVVDSIGNGNGTINGTVSWVNGTFGVALYLDGNDKIDLTANSELNTSIPLTWEMWINRTALGTNGLMSQKDSIGGFTLAIISDKLNFGSNGVDGIDSGLKVDQNQWNYTALTYGNSMLNFFVDKNNTNVSYSRGGTNVSLWAGVSATTFMTGRIDEIRISKIVRSPAWINRSYDNINYSLFTFGIEENQPVPIITLTFPTNITYNVNVTDLNYTYYDVSPDSCWYSLDNGVTNSSPQTCGLNWTGLSSNQGTNTWKVYINNSFNMENSSSVTFFRDDIIPVINLITPTNNTHTNTIENFTAQITDVGGIVNATLYIYNSSNSLVSEQFNAFAGNPTSTELGLEYNLSYEDTFIWYYTATDIYNQSISENFTIIWDETDPTLTFYTPITPVTVTSSPYTINVSASDPYLDATNVTVYNEAGAVIFTNFSGNLTDTIWWMVDAVTLNEGVNTLEVCARDSLESSPKIEDNANFTKRNAEETEYVMPDGNVVVRELVIKDEFNNKLNAVAINLVTTEEWVDGGKHYKTTWEFDDIGAGFMEIVMYDDLGHLELKTDRGVTRVIDKDRNYYWSFGDMESAGFELEYDVKENGQIEIKATKGTYDNAGGRWIVDPIVAGLNTICQNESIELDTTSPVVDVTYPVESAWYDTATLDLDYTYTEINCDSAWYSLDAGATNSSPTSCGQNWTSLTASVGSNTWTVYVNDTVGHESSDSNIFNVDLTFPILSIVYPVESGLYDYDVDDLNYTYVETNCNETWYSVNAGVTNSSVNVCGINFTSVSSATGSNTWVLYIKNLAGNENSTSVTFTQDTTAPTGETGGGGSGVTRPYNNSYTKESGTNFTVNASDDVGIQNVTFFVLNETDDIINQTTYEGYSATEIFFGFFYNLYQETVYKWFFRIVDVVGNVFDTATSQVTYDITEPEGAILYPLSTSYNHTITAMNFSVVETNPHNCWYSTNLGATNSSVTCGNNVTGLSSSEGSNTWKFWVNDSVAFINESSVTFITDTTAPTISIISPIQNAPAFASNYDTDEILVNISTSDALVGVDSVWFYNGSTNVTYTTPTILTFPEASITIIAYVNDTLNNINSASVTFLVDITLPSVTITTNIINQSTDSLPVNITFNYSINDTNIDSCNYNLDFNESLNVGAWGYCKNIYFTSATDYDNAIIVATVDEITFNTTQQLTVGNKPCGDGDVVEIKSTVLQNGSDWATLTFLANFSQDLVYSVYYNSSHSKSNDLELVDDFCEFNDDNFCGWEEISNLYGNFDGRTEEGNLNFSMGGLQHNSTLLYGKSILFSYVLPYESVGSSQFEIGYTNNTNFLFQDADRVGMFLDSRQAFYKHNFQIEDVIGTTEVDLSTSNLQGDDFMIVFISLNETGLYNVTMYDDDYQYINSAVSPYGYFSNGMFLGMRASSSPDWNLTVDYLRAYDNESFYVLEDTYNYSVGGIGLDCSGTSAEIEVATEGYHNLSIFGEDLSGNRVTDNQVFYLFYHRYNQNSDTNTTSEGSSVGFNITITETDYFDTIAYLVYDGAEYLADSYSIDGDEITLVKEITIPSGVGNLTGKDVNWYWKYSIEGNSYWEENYSTSNSTQTIYSVEIDDCSVFNNTILHYDLNDEGTDTTMSLANRTTDVETEVQIISLTNPEVYWDFNRTFTTTNGSICIPEGILNYSDYRIDIIISYVTEDYAQEFWYIDNGLLLLNTYALDTWTNRNITLRELLLVDSSTFLFKYYDENYLIHRGAIVILYRKYIGEGVFKEAERCQLDNNGECHLHLVEEDVIYKFRVIDEGTLEFESGEYNAKCVETPCRITLQKGAVGGEWDTEFDALPEGTYDLNSDKDTRTVTLTFNLNETGTMQLDVYVYSNVINSPDTLVASDTSTAKTGEIEVTIPLSYGNQTYYAVVRHNDGFVTSKWVDMNERGYKYFGTLGLFLGALLVLTLGLIAISTGGWTVAFLILGLLIASITKLIDMDFYLIMWVVSAGGLIVWKLSTRRSI